ncbi:hypothetical protein L7F22_003934 [Adiantum nelumboides]|nr:hypothetical protein [Adiantum nelumboides]
MTEDLMLTSTQRLPSSVAPMHLEGGEGVPVMHGPMQANVVPHPLQGPLQTDGAKKKQYHDQERHVGKIREEGDFHDDDDEPPSRSRHKKRTNERRTKRSRRNSSGGSSSSSQSGRSSHGRFPKKGLSFSHIGSIERSLPLARHIDTLDWYTFSYPQAWIQEHGEGTYVFFRDRVRLDENVSVEISSPSSSRFKKVRDFGSPDQAAQKVLKQYLTKFMTTRIGVYQESKFAFTQALRLIF